MEEKHTEKPHILTDEEAMDCILAVTCGETSKGKVTDESKKSKASTKTE